MADVSTSGWDVVSVTDIETLNKVINEGDNHPKSFSDYITVVGNDLKVEGEWGDWSIANEASGKNIYMQCSIKNATVTYIGKSYPINDDKNASQSTLNIEISLDGIETDPTEWIGDDETSEISKDTKCYKLMVDSKAVIVVTGSNYTNKDLYSPENGLASLVDIVLKNWFNRNVGTFKQVFSVVLIGLKANKGDFQWLKPSAYSYSANSSIDQKSAAFAALTLVDGKTDIGDLQQTVDIAALQVVKEYGANAALIISKSMFVKHILLEAAVALVKGSTKADFEIDKNGLSLTNIKDTVWQDFVGPDDEIMSPTIPAQSFILTLQSDFIHISISGAHYRPRWGVTVYMGIEQNFRYKVEKNKDGEPVFVPDEKGLDDAVVSCSVKFDDWLDWLNIVTGIVTSIASVIALGTSLAGVIAETGMATLVPNAGAKVASFSFKLFNFTIKLEKLAPIAAAIQRGVASNPSVFNVVKIGSAVTAATTGIIWGATTLSEAIYHQIFDDVPSFKIFARNFTGAVKWPGIENMELKSATLVDSFVIGLKMS